MFRTIGDPVSLWASRLPAEVLRLVFRGLGFRQRGFVKAKPQGPSG